MHSRDYGHYHLSQGRGPLETENTNPFVIFGPPTTPGETPGGALYRSALNATPVANVTHQNWTNNTWGINRVLKYSGDREYYFNNSPAGYNDADGELAWVASGYNSTKALTEEEQKEVNEKAGDMATISAHKNLANSVWMAQKQIYPVADSTSYISPYSQRDHAWNDAQHDQSDEVKWSGETNTTAPNSLDWVENEQGNHSRLYPALAQRRNKHVVYHDRQSRLVPYDARDDAWTDDQSDRSNEAEWQAHIVDVGQDYFHSANTASEDLVDNANPNAATTGSFVQRRKMIYPVADSTSYISPYSQRDHAWNDAQHDQSDEVKWSGETNTTAPNSLDWVENG